MELYSAKIQLDGSRDNEVLRHDLTAAEVLVLKEIHGGEFVKEIKLTGTVSRKDSEERARLLGEGETPGMYPVKYISTVFPSAYAPLPAALPAEMLDVEAMVKDAKPVEAAKPVDEMTDEEIEAELKLADARRGYLAKARKAKADNAAKAAAQATSALD